MFDNDAQCARVCNALTHRIRGVALWSTTPGDSRPLPLAESLLRSGISKHEATMLHMAWIVWNGGYGRAKTSRLSRLLDGLDAANLRMIGSLLMAISSSNEIDRWLEAWEASGDGRIS